MKKLFYFLLATLLFAGCRTTRTVTKHSAIEVKQRDSVVIHDSTIYHHLTALHDSVIVRDSVVIVKDVNGRIIGTERYRTSDRIRDQTKQEATFRKNEIVQDRSIIEKAKEVKTDTKKNNFGWFALFGRTALFLLLLYMIYKTYKAWK